MAFQKSKEVIIPYLTEIDLLRNIVDILIDLYLFGHFRADVDVSTGFVDGSFVERLYPLDDVFVGEVEENRLRPVDEDVLRSHQVHAVELRPRAEHAEALVEQTVRLKPQGSFIS